MIKNLKKPILNMMNNISKRYEVKMKVNSKNFFLDEWCKTKIKLVKLYDDRQINSLYYDTYNFQSATDNLNGYANRVKYRLRWYGNKYNKNVNVEFKIRLNKFNFKKIFSLNNSLENINIYEAFGIYNDVFKRDYQNVVNLIGYKRLFPVLNVTYLRSYYYYEDIVVTFDRDITYNLFNSKKTQSKKDFGKVIELKIPEKYLKYSNKLINQFPFRVTRNSKYITGLSLLGKASYL